ncbi:hypothetical protein GVX81_09925 [[Haemophilus] felis]|uniref:Transferrin-binding protein B C-lobe/N-lobe beta barrel domain-containing protein n=1 Tax=[Haemophilus] felis TaxID=123822 RepID=A0A1T0AVP4_9PAST|nr:hypothetical protein [[Haemophilus] felis]OOS01150.1 hypothetical protein B0188_10220 [[Haemophilus] felis]
MKFTKTILATAILSLGLTACGGGGGGGGASGGSNANQPAPVNPAAEDKYTNKDFIDPQGQLDDDHITLKAGATEKKTVLGKDAEISVTVTNASGVGIFFEEKIKNGQKIDEGQKAKVMALNAHFSGQMFVALSNDSTKAERRNVVFTVNGGKIWGHSLKKSKTDLQANFKETNIVAKNQKVGFDGIGQLELTHDSKKETGNYVGYFFGQNGNVTGLTGEMTITNQSGVSNVGRSGGVFYAEKE